MHHQKLLRICIIVLWILLPISVSAEQFTGIVVGISDGDTLSVLRDGKAAKVRLYGIDTPEKTQAFGTKAKQVAGQLAFQQRVTVMIHTTDRYGRLVGEVVLPDGRNVGHELVRAGLAWHYLLYARKDGVLAQLEAEARAAKRGLWYAGTAVPPWDYRRRCPSTKTRP